MSSELEFALGICSIVFYTIVYFPQFYIIYKTKYSDGISLPMLLFWTQADALSLIGTILLQMPLALKIIGWYHFVIGMLLVQCVLYYRERATLVFKASIAVFFGWNMIASVLVEVGIKTRYITEGKIVGWVTALLYIVGRIPQLIQNQRNKSTKGLSVFLYINTILGNSCFLASLLVHSTSTSYIDANLPWIVLIGVTNIMDIIVIAQCVYFRRSRVHDGDDIVSIC